MRLLVVQDELFARGPDGEARALYCAPGFWERYRAVFDEVVVLGRLLEETRAPSGAARVESAPGIRFQPLPRWRGPLEGLLAGRRALATHPELFASVDCALLRVPSGVALLTQPHLRRARLPYAVEVIGDPWDALAPGAVSAWWRVPARPLLALAMRLQVRGAAAAAYNTRALQRRYPPGRRAHSVSYPSVDLTADAFAAQAWVGPLPATPRLLTVASLERPYKGIDVLLEALARLRAPASLVVVGDGSLRSGLEAQAVRLGLGARARFVGRRAPGAEVRAALADADLFVLPSRVDAFPRALVEAMAAGLPCVGSAVGDVPDLLEPDAVVPPGEVAALADRLDGWLARPARLAAAAARNLERARELSSERLASLRRALYERLREEALRARGGRA